MNSDLEQVADHIFRVKSESAGSNSIYNVDITPGDPKHCTCMAFAMKRNKNVKAGLPAEGWCKHIDKCIVYERDSVQGQKRAAKAEADRIAQEFASIQLKENLQRMAKDLESM